MKKIALYNRDGELVRYFIKQGEAQRYCVENKICNAGWVSRSLKTGEKFYYTKNRISKSYKGYQGEGMYVKWEIIETPQGNSGEQIV